MTGSVGPQERAAALGVLSQPQSFGGLHAPESATRVLNAIVRVVLPPVCAGCGASGYWMCPLCNHSSERIDLAKVCRRCGQRSADGLACSRCGSWGTALVGCRSAYLFDGAVRQMVHRLKYRGEHARSEWCGIEVARLAIEVGSTPDFLAPVPLHRTRMRSRGYNQSAKIAKVVSQALGVPWGDVLSRTRATISQVGLDAERRRENVAGAFACFHDLSDLSVLLIDDVVTTGATLDACAEACQRAGAREVRAVTLATGS